MNRTASSPLSSPSSSAAGVLLLVGSLVVIVSCGLPWLSAVNVSLEGGGSTLLLTWNLLYTRVLLGLPFVLVPLVWLIVDGSRSLFRHPLIFGRRKVITRALFGLLGTGIALLIVGITAGFQTLGFLRGLAVEERVEMGFLVCLAGYTVALLGALRLPKAAPGQLEEVPEQMDTASLGR